MARYVLVAFEDNAEADKFVNAAKVYATDERTSMSEVFGEVVGVFFKPTQFCECPTLGNMSRGKKFGAWVHTCGKPVRGQWQHPRNLAKEDDKTLYEQGLYLGIVEPQEGPMPTIDFRSRGKSIGTTR